MTRHWFEDGPEPEVFREAADLDRRSRASASAIQRAMQARVYSGVFCLLALRNARDWRRGEDIRLQELQDHHIFPQAYLKRHGITKRVDVNTIANRTLISNETNGKIKDKAPADVHERRRHLPVWGAARPPGAALHRRRRRFRSCDDAARSCRTPTWRISTAGSSSPASRDDRGDQARLRHQRRHRQVSRRGRTRRGLPPTSGRHRAIGRRGRRVHRGRIATNLASDLRGRVHRWTQTDAPASRRGPTAQDVGHGTEGSSVRARWLSGCVQRGCG